MLLVPCHTLFCDVVMNVILERLDKEFLEPLVDVLVEKRTNDGQINQSENDF